MKKERVAIFIDGSNLYNNLKTHNLNIKIKDIIPKLESKREIVSIFYYTAQLDKEHDLEKFRKHEKFLEKIKEIPKMNVVLSTLRKTVLKDGSMNFMIKGDDVHLATDLIVRAYENKYDLAIIVSGDEDFIPSIQAVQKIGKKVINAFFPKSSSYLLRNCCDGSINLKRKLMSEAPETKRSPDAANRMGQLSK